MGDSDTTTVEQEGATSRSSVDGPADPISREPAGWESVGRESVGHETIGRESVGDGSTGRQSTSGGLGARLRSRTASLFSARVFLLSTVATVGGFLVVGGALPLGAIGGLLGIAAGGFLTGALAGQRRYAETAAAGGAVGATAAFLDHLVLSVLGIGLPLVALGAVGGLLAGLLGHYFGRDLRDGLTREL